MSSRIEELMRSEGLTSVKFAEILSVQPSNISHIISGRNKPSYDFIVKLLERFPNVNPEWLLLGEGSIYKSNHNNSTQENLVTNVNTSNEISLRQHDGSTNISDNQDINLFQNISQSGDSISEIVPEPTASLSKSNQINSALNKVSEKSQKTVTKIILVYSDNSFEFLENIV